MTDMRPVAPTPGRSIADRTQLAAMNKCLALMSKSLDVGEATTKWKSPTGLAVVAETKDR